MIDERLGSAIPGVKWGGGPDFVTRIVCSRLGGKSETQRIKAGGRRVIDVGEMRSGCETS